MKIRFLRDVDALVEETSLLSFGAVNDIQFDKGQELDVIKAESQGGVMIDMINVVMADGRRTVLCVEDIEVMT